jgi:hypothetical protein
MECCEVINSTAVEWNVVQMSVKSVGAWYNLTMKSLFEFFCLDDLLIMTGYEITYYYCICTYLFL